VAGNVDIVALTASGRMRRAAGQDGEACEQAECCFCWSAPAPSRSLKDKTKQSGRNAPCKKFVPHRMDLSSQER
ncbi:MAG TPA: hypothetical protein VHI72_08625, partial [Hyphomicrobiaceae bacterium]|nr:hypothetical protein [Hyphomicrobiaceae bacterium]